MGDKMEKMDSPASPYRLSWTAFINLGMLGVGLALEMLSPTSLYFSEQMEVSITEIGAMFIRRAAGHIAGALVCGKILDLTGKPALVLLLALAGTCAVCFALPLLKSYRLAGFLFMFQGFSVGMVDTAGNVLILALWRESKYLNCHMYAMHFLRGLGTFVAPLFVEAWVARGLAPMSAWMATGAVVMPSMFAFFGLNFTSQPKIADKSDKQHLCVRKCTKELLWASVFLFAYMANEVSFGNSIASFASAWLEASEANSRSLASLYWASLCLGRLVAAFVAPYVSQVTYVVAHLVAALLAVTVMFGLTRDPESLEQDTGWWLKVVLLTATFGFAMGPLFPGMVLMIEKIQQAPLIGTTTSIMVTLALLGKLQAVALTASIGEHLSEYFGLLQIFLCVCTLGAFAAMVGGSRTDTH